MTQQQPPGDAGDARSPRTAPVDFHEGRGAADRFRAAVGRLASIPPGSVPRSTPPAPKAKRGRKLK